MKRSFEKLLAYAAALVVCVQGGAVFASAEGTASAVTGLTVAEYPDVMAYHIGDELITDGIRVEARYEDGTTADVTADCTFDYDFSEKGNARVEVAYEGKTTTYSAVVVPEQFSIHIYDPVSGSIDNNGYYILKEGETLGNEHYAMIMDDTDQSEVGMVELSADQITGFTSEPGEKVLTGHVAVGGEMHTFAFPALVLKEADYEQYVKVREDIHLYEHSLQNDYSVEVYNFNGVVNEKNLVPLLYYADLSVTSGSPFPSAPNSCVPASQVKAWLEEVFVISEFDVSKSPNYNAQDDTITWNDWGWGFGGCGLPFYKVTWSQDTAGNLEALYTVKETSPTHDHNAQIIYAPDGRIVSVTMMPEKLELVSAPSKTTYEQGENLDLTGGQIKATYDEERSETLPMTADMISGYDSAKAGKQTVTVTVGDQSVSFDVTVTASENPSPVVIDDKETGIRLEASEGVVPSDTVLKAEKVTDGENFTIVDKALTDTADKWVAYDIRLLSDNAEIQPNGKVKIAIPRPTELNADKLALFHVAQDGKLTQISYTLDEATDRIVFETDHFSLYVVAETSETDSGSSNPPTGYSGQGILPLTILLVAGAAVLLLRKRQTAR